MAQLGNLLVTGSSRLLGKLFCNDISVGNSLSVKTLNATNFTATSITTSGLTVNGNATTIGTLNVGNSQANGKILVNGKVAIRDYGYNWLGINDGYAESWSASGIFFGKSIIRTDNAFQLGNNGDKVLFNTSSAKFTVPVTINNSLAANNITATNVTVNDTLKAFKYELNTIQDLGGEFCVAPTIYIQSGATVNVSKASSTTITVSILDTTAITSDSIQGVRWAQNSKIKFQGKIDGVNIRCSGIMAAKLNTTANTMSLTLTVESSIADHFATAKNGASYSDISVMLYQRYGKKIGSTTENVYSPVGIRMSATGSANAAPYVDIWGSKSSSDPDTVYTVPSVRLGYLEGLSTTLNGISISCNGYGLYADNVYLNGTIMSNSGTIGGFKIDYNSLTNGTWGTDKSVLVCTGTASAKAVGGSSAINGWCFTAGSKFGVTISGDLYASNANISGTVTSASGSIGGFTISQYNIKGTNVGLGCASGHDYAFWAGNSTGSASPFRVGHDGSLTATKATITGTIISDNITATSGKIGSFNLDSKFLQSSDETVGLSATETNWAFWAGGSTADTAKFRVTQAGTLYTKDIQATAGKIGKYTITGTSLWTGDGSTCSGIGGNQAFWAGSDTSNDAPFRVSYAGALVATNATISGDVTATSGKIGGCSITDGVLKVASGNITSVNASNITSGTLSADRIGANSITVGKITTENLAGANGWINLNKGTFNYGNDKLTWDGTTLSMNGTITTNNITATAGKIGGWILTSNSLYVNNKTGMSSNTGKWAFWAGETNSKNGTSDSNAVFRVGHNGGLMTSDITATGGTIGGCKIENGVLKVASANITSVNADNITAGTLKADRLDITGVFAKDITATGSISGVTIKGASGEFTKAFSVNSPVGDDGSFQINNTSDGIFIGIKTQDVAQSYLQLDPIDAYLSGHTVTLSGGQSISIGAKASLKLECPEGITVNNNLNCTSYYYRNSQKIGETITSSVTTTRALASGAWTNTTAGITLPAGVYLLVGTIIYASGKGGRRGARFANGSDGLPYTSQVVSQDSSAAANAYIQCQWIVEPTASNTYYLQGFQSTGSNLNITASYIKAVRIA